MKKRWDLALPAAHDFFVIFDLRIFESSSLLQDLTPGLSKFGASGFGRIRQISFQTLPDDPIEPLFLGVESLDSRICPRGQGNY
jgi:hypothetical protein